jgi:hypothetical protein
MSAAMSSYLSTNSMVNIRKCQCSATMLSQAMQSAYVDCFLNYDLCSSSSAASVLRSFHTGMPYYQKGKASDNGFLLNPQVSFLGASNGVRHLCSKMCLSIENIAFILLGSSYGYPQKQVTIDNDA